MQIHLSEVLGLEENTAKTYTAPLSFDTFDCFGRICPVKRKEPVTLSLLHKKGKKLFITAEVHVLLGLPCDRCLREVQVPLDFVSEFEVDMNQTDEERVRNLEEAAFIEGYTLDVDRLVCGEMLVHMPMKVLCSEDCKGLDEGHGTTSGHSDSGADEEALDPRMAVIRDIFQKANSNGDKEV